MDPDGFGYGVVSGKKGEAEGWFGSWLKDCPSDPSSLPRLLGSPLSCFLGFSHADAALGSRER